MPRRLEINTREYFEPLETGKQRCRGCDTVLLNHTGGLNRHLSRCKIFKEARANALNEGWVQVHAINAPTDLNGAAAAPGQDDGGDEHAFLESIQERITRITEDIKELNAFYIVQTSPSRYQRLSQYYASEVHALDQQPFDSFDEEDKVDFLLLKNYLNRAYRNLKIDRAKDKEFAPLVEPFGAQITAWVEARMRVEPVKPRAIATSFADLVTKVKACREEVEEKPDKYSQAIGFRAARAADELRGHLSEMFDFYSGYDPLFDWWVKDPYSSLDDALKSYVAFLREKLLGIKPGDEDAIAGDPIGRPALLAELGAELIPYSPEELIKIANKEYAWCETEMIKASSALGFGDGDDWRAALEHVKGFAEEPGAQPPFIKSLVDEGAAYVRRHDLVTVPRLAAEAVRMTMIPPARQRVSPFFLGGKTLQVSYPTSSMAHADKMMSMRGNNRHFSRATAFHEMIPGHHLQLYVADRVRPHRRLFSTPFYVEGWALYWELVFWERGDFFASPEDRVGSIFWRMHRCARIIFSLSFHLGKMTPEECVQLLVDKVGHERATAEGEVRRSLSGEYSPLYQAGYLLGALQLWKLRQEVVGAGVMGEKAFHDRVLQENMMPIEILRSSVLDLELTKDFKSSWRFYGEV